MIADARCILQQSLEHWRQIAARACDDAQRLVGGRLPLHGFTQLALRQREPPLKISVRHLRHCVPMALAVF
jgi:hypothetical protein